MDCYRVSDDGQTPIEARCNETNQASLKLLEKSGFQVDARLRGRRVDLLTGERDDLIITSIA
ncbi:MAG: GNAT family N-acetyltransferase [Lachnospiraceae bacterium]|nr:GNAT family N-acetyltransferase [Lachnospiraceae bacterium]